MRAAVAVLGLLAPVLLIGCRAHGPGGTAADCGPPRGDLPRDFEAGSLAGSHALVLVATVGPEAGAATTGELRLSPWETDPPPAFGEGEARPVLHGWTAGDGGAVGARAAGRLDSADPERPGVLVFSRGFSAGAEGGAGEAEVADGEGADEESAGGEGEAAGRPRVLLRLGSTANDPTIVRFDGDYTVLEVGAADAEGFAGTWRSGGGDATDAAGHFCARRRAE